MNLPSRGINREWNVCLTENVSPDELEVFHKVLSLMEQNAKRIADELEVK